MSHLDSWGIIAGHLAGVPAGIAKRWRRERDLRDAWPGPFGPGDCPGLGLARNTVLRYLNSPEAMLPKPRPPRGSKLDPYTEHIDRRLAEGLENCVVLLRELRTRRIPGELHDPRGVRAPPPAGASARGDDAV